MRHDESQAARAQRSSHAEKDRHVVFEHLLPDAMRRGEIAALKRNPLHLGENRVGGEAALDREWFDRRVKKTRLLRHVANITSQRCRFSWPRREARATHL